MYIDTDVMCNHSNMIITEKAKENSAEATN